MQTKISNAVAQALNSVGMSADEFLRHALNVNDGALVTPDGVMFPEGSAMLAWYKDRPYWGHVVNGMIDIDGERFRSVSAAAVHITKRPTNGWDFWQCRLPGKSEFVRISRLRAH